MAGVDEQGGEPERLREGDPVAWETFYQRVYPMMLAYSQRRLGYNEVARDAVSEALARTVTTVVRMADVGTSPVAWSFGILRNVVIDAQRRAYREHRFRRTDSALSLDPTESLELRSEHENVRRAFDQLNDAERELLELRVVGGLSSDHVASVLGMTPGAVRMAQARALVKLRNLLSEEVQP